MSVQGGGGSGFPELPQVALDNAIDHLLTFLGGNHEVGGAGGFPELPQAALGNAIDHLPTLARGEGGADGSLEVPQVALDNAIDHLPTFLGGNHVVDWSTGSFSADPDSQRPADVCCAR